MSTGCSASSYRSIPTPATERRQQEAPEGETLDGEHECALVRSPDALKITSTAAGATRSGVFSANGLSVVIGALWEAVDSPLPDTQID